MIRESKVSDYNALKKLSIDAHIIFNDFHVSKTFVFEDKHKIKGFISLSNNNHIIALAVNPLYQNQRIASKLLCYIRRNKTTLFLRIFSQNCKSLRFYQKHGFKMVSENFDETLNQSVLLLAWAQGCFAKHVKFRKGES